MNRDSITEGSTVRESTLYNEKYQKELLKISAKNSSETAENDSIDGKKIENIIQPIREDDFDPFEGLSKLEVASNAYKFATENDLKDYADIFFRAGILAFDGDIYPLTSDEQRAVKNEREHKWTSQPFPLYYMAVMCAMCAVVQGMDETVINGAQLYIIKEFRLDLMKNSEWLIGTIVGAPYLCCCLIGCALTGPLNKLLGRRGVIFLSCVIVIAASLWQSFSKNWVQIFIARLFLGLGIGPKSATVPVFSAECSPASIRGGLVMMWQMWTAFGIMLGFIVDVLFIPRGSLSESVAWRLMMGSTCVVPVFICIQIYLIPESPSWYLGKNKVKQAYESLCRYRSHKILAARDLYYMSQLKAISETRHPDNLLLSLFKEARNRRALVASQILMFLQQFCGVNIIAYFSSKIFIDSGFSEKSSILASMGFGILNFIFAIPAVFTIDTFGRRALTLFTLPFLAIVLLFTGFSFWIPDKNARLGCVTSGIYLYAIFYSPGMGPVPFTYSAEAFPSYVRDVGMSLATITLWGFNFLLSATWPPLLRVFKPQGAFGYYAAWNVIGFVLVFFFVPETKALTLEELDSVFSTSTKTFINHQLTNIPSFLRKTKNNNNGQASYP